LPYRVHHVDTAKNANLEPWFLAINPQGHLPALTDIHPDGSRVRLFESGAIMQYLIDTYDKNHRVSYPKGSPEAIEVNNWLFFQHSAVGPVHGEAEHFSHRAPEKIPYSIDRFTNKAVRLYIVLDKHLAATNTEYLVGNKWCVLSNNLNY
jgi:glutathione S-transferase